MMCNKRFFFLAVIVIFSFISVFSQEESYRRFIEDLNIKFNNKEIRALEDAAELFSKAELKLNDANLLYSELTELDIKERMSDDYEAALDKLFDAAETYKEAYIQAYDVLNERSEDFWKTMEKTRHRAAGMDKAHYYENTSNKNRHRSLIRYEQAVESDTYMYSLEILKDANKLAALAVRNIGRSVQICEDYPVEYNYGWDDDKTLEEIIALLQDPNINEPPEDIFATLDKEQPIDSSLLKEVIFKVQIAAHTDPLSEEYLNALYKGGMKIDLIYEEGWYKYSIGRYRQFDEAEATQRECNVSKAFVVAYQEGKKISTQEAIGIAEKKIRMANE